MQNESFLLSPVSGDYYCQTVTGLIPATGQRAYVPALPELVFFFEPNQLTEARTGMLFARAAEMEELAVEVSLLLERLSPDRIRAIIAAKPSL